MFGQTLILSAFNFAKGRVYGLELTGSYTNDSGFSCFGNLARSVAKGTQWSSAQFLFDPSDLAYVKDHWIHLDHDQSLTASCGASYRWAEGSGSTLVHLDVLYGSGLRNDATAADGSTIPNGASVPSYVTANVGVEQRFHIDKSSEWRLRLDIVNLADKSYELRDGSGVGVNAAQFGMRRAVFGTVLYRF